LKLLAYTEAARLYDLVVNLAIRSLILLRAYNFPTSTSMDQQDTEQTESLKRALAKMSNL